MIMHRRFRVIYYFLKSVAQTYVYYGHQMNLIVIC